MSFDFKSQYEGPYHLKTQLPMTLFVIGDTSENQNNNNSVFRWTRN